MQVPKLSVLAGYESVFASLLAGFVFNSILQLVRDVDGELKKYLFNHVKVLFLALCLLIQAAFLYVLVTPNQQNQYYYSNLIMLNTIGVLIASAFLYLFSFLVSYLEYKIYDKRKESFLRFVYFAMCFIVVWIVTVSITSAYMEYKKLDESPVQQTCFYIELITFGLISFAYRDKCKSIFNDTTLSIVVLVSIVISVGVVFIDQSTDKDKFLEYILNHMFWFNLPLFVFLEANVLLSTLNILDNKKAF